MRRALQYWAPLAAWMLVIFVASAQPRVPHQDDVPDWLSHGTAYLVLAVLAARAFGAGTAPDLRLAACAFAFCVAYGVSDEWHQSFVPGRHSDPWDVAKDGVGATVGVALLRAWSQRNATDEARAS
ncbi:MAG TPA: VanZ family protein [Vicinamibacteria bacterium]|nr:VanZ family protein [Vicinamibacteria bacterium]